jgi:hypothetical protein
VAVPASAAPAPACGSRSRARYLRAYPPQWREARITRGLCCGSDRIVEAHGARLVVVVLNGREDVPHRMATMRAFNPELLRG